MLSPASLLMHMVQPAPSKKTGIVKKNLKTFKGCMFVLNCNRKWVIYITTFKLVQISI